ncbi:MAG: DUF6912 family protein [Jiangellaceae bacterium]
MARGERRLMRVFIAATMPMLTELSSTGWLSAASGCAVTPALLAALPDAHPEELEYAALTEAARVSLRLLAASPAAPARRVVVAADVADVRVDPPAGALTVRLPGTVRLVDVGAVHVDDGAAEPAIRAAVVALAASGGDDAPAVEEAEGFELLWFATQEIADLVAG